MASEPKKPDVLSTLEEIRDRLPTGSVPLQISSDDQRAINAHVGEIADGRAVVVAAKVEQPTYPAGVPLVDLNNQTELNANIAKIARGEVLAVKEAS